MITAIRIAQLASILKCGRQLLLAAWICNALCLVAAPQSNEGSGAQGRFRGHATQRWLPMPQVKQGVDPAKQAELLQALKSLVNESDSLPPMDLTPEQLQAVQQALKDLSDGGNPGSDASQVPADQSPIDLSNIDPKWIQRALDNSGFSDGQLPAQARQLLERYAQERQLPTGGSRSGGNGIQLPPGERPTAGNLSSEPFGSQEGPADPAQLSTLSEKLRTLMREAERRQRSTANQNQNSNQIRNAGGSRRNSQSRERSQGDGTSGTRTTPDEPASQRTGPNTGSQAVTRRPTFQRRSPSTDQSTDNQATSPDLRGNSNNNQFQSAPDNRLRPAERQGDQMSPRNERLNPGQGTDGTDSLRQDGPPSATRNDQPTGEDWQRRSERDALLDAIRRGVEARDQSSEGNLGRTPVTSDPLSGQDWLADALKDSELGADSERSSSINGSNSSSRRNSGGTGASRKPQTAADDPANMFDLATENLMELTDQIRSEAARVSGTAGASNRRSRTFDSNLDIRSQVERHGFGRTLKKIVERTLEQEKAASKSASQWPTTDSIPSPSNDLSVPDLSAIESAIKSDVRDNSSNVQRRSPDNGETPNRSAARSRSSGTRRSSEAAESKFSKMADSFWQAVKEPASSSASRAAATSSPPAVSGPNTGGGGWEFNVGMEHWITLGLILLLLAWGGWRLTRGTEATVRKAEAKWAKEVLRAGLKTRGDIVRAYHHLVLRRPRPAMRWWTHRSVATHLLETCPTMQHAIEELTALYEAARYLPPDHHLPERDLERARHALQQFEAVGA